MSVLQIQSVYANNMLRLVLRTQPRSVSVVENNRAHFSVED